MTTKFHEPRTGGENTITRQFRGGILRTFSRDAAGYWQCQEQPLPKPVRHLRDAVRTISRKLGKN